MNAEQVSRLLLGQIVFGPVANQGGCHLASEDALVPCLAEVWIPPLLVDDGVQRHHGNKARYTEAHLQVYGRHQGLEELLSRLGRKEVDALAKIHLPVGGRRELERLGYAVGHPKDSRSKALILKLIGCPPRPRTALDDEMSGRRAGR